ncbi:MAG: hypothetical protein AAFX06_21750 [Planctomycetota bacterium]
MYSPAPGFPIEGRAISGCPGRTLNEETGDVTMHLFQFRPYEYEPIEGGTQVGRPNEDVGFYFVRNRFKEEMEDGAELTVMLDAEGIGVILVWECNDG